MPRRIQKTKGKTPAKLRRHARQRAGERYGVDLKRSDLEAINHLIQSGQWSALERESNTRTRGRVFYAGRQLDVIYDKLRHEVATFLTPEEAADDATTK